MTTKPSAELRADLARIPHHVDMASNPSVRYEGWKNFTTWYIALRIDNEYAFYREMMDTTDIRAFVSQVCELFPQADQVELFEHWDSKRREAQGYREVFHA